MSAKEDRIGGDTFEMHGYLVTELEFAKISIKQGFHTHCVKRVTSTHVGL